MTFLACITYVQFRGRVRHEFSRYADVCNFPALRQVTEQWEMIREAALKLFDEGHIRAASGYNDSGFNTFFRRG